MAEAKKVTAKAEMWAEDNTVCRMVGIMAVTETTTQVLLEGR